MKRVAIIVGVAASVSTGALIDDAVRSAEAGQIDVSAAAGFYTEEQAARGEDQYYSACAVCHLESLAGSFYAPPLTGETFMAAWSDQSVDDLYNRTRLTMPGDAAGSLSRQAYIDIVAYMLKANQFPAGTEELKAEPDVLKAIRIAVAK